MQQKYSVCVHMIFDTQNYFVIPDVEVSKTKASLSIRVQQLKNSEASNLGRSFLFQKNQSEVKVT